MPGAVILGAGPGLGRAIARRFAREGLSISLIARNRATVESVAATLADLEAPVLGLSADCTDESALRTALEKTYAAFGVPEVVVYNAAIIQADTVGELSVSDHLDAWAVNVVGAHTAAAQVIPKMTRSGSGTFLVTGGMPAPKREYVSLSLGKAGLRTLVDLLDQEYLSAGIHVAAVTVDGPIAPGTAFDPDDIAEHYWTLHSQPRELWQREIVHTENSMPPSRLRY
ncbi:SDR family NAD(P)-dependent oxidoreductase [Nocardioides panzhihuensis]|uniref:NAD(P)-dependent dehydrogenase (Short-subunit alcohol dehydrogenase family) n=1 Tax=Nocardioides panzhihuensis TaxID=860243 RepID=A0A7Z0DL48_9ACTN|nr:SDR family NAD(P)-dependent oxidoreductase [Nocardioides panzhihuensis]NYI77590.1 NAD(P)-dependent dehydrogenase (short-subunit alcohol dehydrogenase family) [Nocardioides panzhihuensis]